jgi:hypothetical protein
MFISRQPSPEGVFLVTWWANAWAISNVSFGSFSVSTKVKQLTTGLEWWLTTVYGPSRDPNKPTFLEELLDLGPTHNGTFLVMDDFNMIYKAEDKNNDHLNHLCMGQFCRFLNELIEPSS